MSISVGGSLQKPLIMDEMEYPAVAEAIKDSGRPNYYRGETLKNNEGLWHPPLYIIALATWQSIFGSSVIASRTFGFFNAIVAVILIGVFVILRIERHNINWQIALSVCLVVLLGLGVAFTAPLLIQGATLPDIDTQVLPLTIITFFLLMFELRRHGVREWRYWLIFGVAMAVQFFTKLTTPALLVPSFMVFELVRGISNFSAISLRVKNSSSLILEVKYKTILRILLKITLPLFWGSIGLILMMGIWFIIARLWGVTFSLPFAYLTQSSNNPANLGDNAITVFIAIIQNIPSHFLYFAQWAGYPTLFFVLLMLVREFYNSSNDGILSGLERSALYTFVILLTLMYVVLRPAPFDFPKYYPPLIPLLGLLAVDLLTSLRKRGFFTITVAILILEVISYLFYVNFNKQFANQDFIYEIYHNWPKAPIFWDWMLLPLLFFGTANGLFWVLSKRRISEPILIAVLAVTLGWQIAVTARQMNETYSTTYYYGENSLNEVAAYLSNTMPENIILIAPKDVGFLLQDRWRYIELTVDPRPHLKNPEVKYLVARVNDYYGVTIRNTPDVANTILNEFEIVTTIENFVIMQRKS